MKLPFFSRRKSKDSYVEQAELNKENIVADTDDMSSITVNSLLALTENNQSRASIYKNFMLMERDPVINTALRMHAIAALGGHESKGDLIFIESTANATDDEKKMVAELREDLLPIFNKIAFNLSYTAIAFGDAYVRTYYKKGEGLLRCVCDEQVHPSLIVPYEQAGETVGYVANYKSNNFAKMTTLQIARMKMPRVSWVPQVGVVSKTYRSNILEDDIDKLPLLPSMVGGSFLFAAEKPYKHFAVSLNCLVGQRLVDSIDEGFLTINVAGSTKEQQERLKKNIIKVLSDSKKIADDAMAGKAYFGRTRHIVFTHGEKQITTQSDGIQSKRAGNVTIDDILLHAKLLAGSLGIDLSMLGFADSLSGGLGEGGFFRASAQIAESSRLIRSALSDFFNDLIDKHYLFKYGKTLPKFNRPFTIDFYGSISAFESERQATRANAVNTAGMVVQIFSQLKELGLTENVMSNFMTKQLMLDEQEANSYSQALLSTQQETGE